MVTALCKYFGKCIRHVPFHHNNVKNHGLFSALSNPSSISAEMMHTDSTLGNSFFQYHKVEIVINAPADILERFDSVEKNLMILGIVMMEENKSDTFSEIYTQVCDQRKFTDETHKSEIDSYSELL